ncbi:MAG TPA: anion transporter, partial [Sulfurospirillum sp. UBA12182]
MYKKIFYSVVLGILSFGISSLVFNQQESILLGIIVSLVALWTNEGLPLGVVSLLPIILFPSFGVLGTNATTINYSQSIIFLFLGGFMLAISVEKTGLHKIIANKMLQLFPATPRGIIFSLSITSGVLSS